MSARSATSAALGADECREMIASSQCEKRLRHLRCLIDLCGGAQKSVLVGGADCDEQGTCVRHSPRSTHAARDFAGHRYVGTDPRVCVLRIEGQQCCVRTAVAVTGNGNSGSIDRSLDPTEQRRDYERHVPRLLGVVAHRCARKRIGRVRERRSGHKEAGGCPGIEQNPIDRGIAVPPVGKDDQWECSDRTDRAANDGEQCSSEVSRHVAPARRRPVRIGQRDCGVLNLEWGPGRSCRRGASSFVS